MIDTISVHKKSHNGSMKRVHSMTTENMSKHVKQLKNIESKMNARDYFLEERPFSNIKIIINQQTVWCDKASLAAASPVLREELLNNNDSQPLLLNDTNLDEFLSMLEFIYPIFNPEINEENISYLIELSDRFQYDMLKQACQIYVIKYLNTIRRVFSTNHNAGERGDYILSNDGNNPTENESHKQRTLIEFHNHTCVDALSITTKLCRWLKTYYYNNAMLSINAIMSVLQQISVDYLEQAATIVDINDEIKSYIYKQHAQYLEQIWHVKHIV